MKQALVKVLDYSLPVAQFGADGPTFLMLAGAGGPEMCYGFAEQLSRLGTVLVPEHPGFGPSENPDWLKVPADLANFYNKLLISENIQEVHLIGHSLGGWIAAEMAVRCQSNLASLTLISSAGIKVRGVPIGDNFLWPADSFESKMYFAPPGANAPARTDDNVALHLKRQATIAQLVWKPRWHDPALQRWLPAIDVPTKIIWGRNDQLFPFENAQFLAQAIPHAILHVIDQCGHLPIVEKACEVISIIKSHFEGDAQ